ncbi:hypothetical protein B0H14DRAFT_2559246 [Mycena olivaceomarginata]|nr:hypothetical protein B0H14DRAFT_2559246 [Mycena olivaceomarginata]
MTRGGSDNSTSENRPSLWDKGKKCQNLAEHQLQELEEVEELERKLAEEHAAADEVLLPEEREEKRRAEEADSFALTQRLQAYKVETRHQIREVEKSVACAEALRLLISEAGLIAVDAGRWELGSPGTDESHKHMHN